MRREHFLEALFLNEGSEHLAKDEQVLWQGRPTIVGLSRGVFHIRAIMGYFAVLAAWNLASTHADGFRANAAFISALWVAVPAIVAAVVIYGMSWLPRGNHALLDHQHPGDHADRRRAADRADTSAAPHLRGRREAERGWQRRHPARARRTEARLSADLAACAPLALQEGAAVCCARCRMPSMSRTSCRARCSRSRPAARRFRSRRPASTTSARARVSASAAA